MDGRVWSTKKYNKILTGKVKCKGVRGEVVGEGGEEIIKTLFATLILARIKHGFNQQILNGFHVARQNLSPPTSQQKFMRASNESLQYWKFIKWLITQARKTHLGHTFRFGCSLHVPYSQMLSFQVSPQREHLTGLCGQHLHKNTSKATRRPW